jgi:hypothetical protein
VIELRRKSRLGAVHLLSSAIWFLLRTLLLLPERTSGPSLKAGLQNCDPSRRNLDVLRHVTFN